MPRNLFVTGSKNSGKTTLLKQIISEFRLAPSGYETLPYFLEGEIKGHYFHSLMGITGIKNNLPFTVQHQEDTCLKVPEVFQLLGTSCLKASLNDENPLMLMDEIGRIEETCPEFLALLETAFDSEKIVLGAVKKADSPYLSQILNRTDAFVVDLDEIPFQQALTLLKTQLKEIL